MLTIWIVYFYNQTIDLKNQKFYVVDDLMNLNLNKNFIENVHLNINVENKIYIANYYDVEADKLEVIKHLKNENKCYVNINEELPSYGIKYKIIQFKISEILF